MQMVRKNNILAQMKGAAAGGLNPEENYKVSAARGLLVPGGKGGCRIRIRVHLAVPAGWCCSLAGKHASPLREGMGCRAPCLHASCQGCRKHGLIVLVHLQLLLVTTALLL
jgi:hypothetical protein